MTDPAKFYMNWTTASWTAANDPCPDGWRVPTVDELGNLTYSDYSSSTHSGSTKNGSWDSTNKGWDFNNGLFLPAAGSRFYYYGGADGRGGRGSYWSSSVSDTNVWYLNFGGYGASMYRTARANGHSVRCVQE